VKRRIIVIVALVVGLVSGFGIAIIRQYVRTYSELPYRQRTPEARARLRRFVYLALPAKMAIDDYHARTGVYPSNISEVVTDSLPPHYIDECFGSGYHSWYYMAVPDTGYHLYMKLGWDCGLFYYSELDRWQFEPGDWVVEP